MDFDYEAHHKRAIEDAANLLAMDKDEFIYLASPYSHPDPMVRLERYHKACEYTATLLNEGVSVFSPIAHSHPVAEHGTENTFDFWMRWDMPYMYAADSMIVMTIDGWRESRGVAAEIEIMRTLGKPIVYSSHGLDDALGD